MNEANQSLVIWLSMIRKQYKSVEWDSPFPWSSIIIDDKTTLGLLYVTKGFVGSLRFYVPVKIIAPLANFNFVICLIKSTFSLNKISSVDQVFFTTFQEKVSKLVFW